MGNKCKNCGSELQLSGNMLVCNACGSTFPIEGDMAESAQFEQQYYQDFFQSCALKIKPLPTAKDTIYDVAQNSTSDAFVSDAYAEMENVISKYYQQVENVIATTPGSEEVKVASRKAFESRANSYKISFQNAMESSLVDRITELMLEVDELNRRKEDIYVEDGIENPEKKIKQRTSAAGGICVGSLFLCFIGSLIDNEIMIYLFLLIAVAVPIVILISLKDLMAQKKIFENNKKANQDITSIDHEIDKLHGEISGAINTMFNEF